MIRFINARTGRVVDVPEEVDFPDRTEDIDAHFAAKIAQRQVNAMDQSERWFRETDADGPDEDRPERPGPVTVTTETDSATSTRKATSRTSKAAQSTKETGQA